MINRIHLAGTVAGLWPGATLSLSAPADTVSPVAATAAAATVASQQIHCADLGPAWTHLRAADARGAHGLHDASNLQPATAAATAATLATASGTAAAHVGAAESAAGQHQLPAAAAVPAATTAAASAATTAASCPARQLLRSAAGLVTGHGSGAVSRKLLQATAGPGRRHRSSGSV